MSNSLIDREITQGVIPIGTPKAYKYDAALVEAAKATVQQGMTGIAEKTEEEKSELDGYTEAKKAEVSTVGQGYVDSASQKVAEANTILSAIRNEYGYPFTAATAADMTDTSKIYVYVGSETGYTNGNWYYHNGTAWVSGGVYNAQALQTDKTLTVSDAAADAKITGDAIKSTKAEMSLFGVDDLLWDNTSPSSKTENGVTFTVDKVNKAITISTVSGGATNSAILNFYSSSSVLPSWLTVGKQYYLHCHTDSDAFIRVSRKIGDSWNYTYRTQGVIPITIGDDVTGLQIQVIVQSGKTVNAVVRPFISETLSLGEVEDAAITCVGAFPSCDLDDLAGRVVGMLISTNTYTNAPHDGFVGLLYNITTSENLSVQYAFAFNKGFLYYRKRLATATPPWSDWRLLTDYDNTMLNKDTIPNNTDLNDLKDTGFYSIQYEYTYTNLPDSMGVTAGLLEVFRMSDNLQYQTLIAYYPYEQQFIRFCVGGTWRPWMGVAEQEYAVSGKYVAFGDSLTKGAVWPATQGQSLFTANKKYQIPTRIAVATGFANNFVNEGVGGTGYVHESSGQTITGKILNYDFTGVQLVTVMGGANDCDGVVELGTSEATAGDGTICGAIKSIIDYIKTNYPKTQVVFIQMTPVSSSSNSWTNMYYGKFSLTTYDTEVSKLCHDNHVGYVNWWESLYVDTWVQHSGGYNGSTGPNYSHPKVEEDYALLGDFIGGKISALCKGLN